MREPVATGMRRTFLAPLVMLQESAERGRQSLLQADAKQSHLDSLSLNSMKAASLEGENARLRKLIGLGSGLRWGFVPAEALHGRGVRDETTVTLSAGSRAGVSRLSPVIAPEGLVGVVDQVDPTMSHAMLWPKVSRVSGRASRRQTRRPSGSWCRATRRPKLPRARRPRPDRPYSTAWRARTVSLRSGRPTVQAPRAPQAGRVMRSHPGR